MVSRLNTAIYLLLVEKSMEWFPFLLILVDLPSCSTPIIADLTQPNILNDINHVLFFDVGLNIAPRDLAILCQKVQYL